MNPRLAADSAPRGSLDAVAPERGPWRLFAAALCVATTAVGVALLAIGEPLPDAPAVLVLVLVLAVAVNRFAFFPSELAVTGEVAVLLAAVVGFADQSALVGPWLVAFLAGPLDISHWRRRSFSRMAYNAGNRMAATLVASVVFTGVFGPASSAVGAVAAAALVASVAFASVEVVVGTVLVRLRTRAAWRHALRVELPMELLTVPLGLVGAAAGWLAVEVGWWQAALVLVPAVFVPEFALVHARRAGVLSARTWAPVTAFVGFAALAVVEWRHAGTFATLAVASLLVGVDARVGPRVLIPRAAGAVVVAALLLADTSLVVVVACVALTTTAVAHAVARSAAWWAAIVALAAAIACALVYEAHRSTAMALLAAALFTLAGATPPPVFAWTLPFLCAAAALAVAASVIGVAGELLFVTGLVVVAVLAARYGSLPWGSRVLGPWAARRPFRGARVLFVALLGTAAITAAVGAALGPAREVAVPGAAVAATAAATIASVASWQWRFDPRARIRDVVLLAAAAVVAVALYPSGARHGDLWSTVALALVVAAIAFVGWPTVRLVRAAASRDRAIVTGASGSAGRGTRRR
jgi:hypothetical protein